MDERRWIQGGKQMKIKGFFKDITGSLRVTKRRNKAIKNASSTTEYRDPIKEVADICHPLINHLVVTSVEDVSPSAKKITFKNKDGSLLPPFEAGQYISLDFQIGKTITTRPFSICTPPYMARDSKNPIIAITVKTGRPNEGFVSNYLYNNVKVGDEFYGHLPFGFFYLEPLRDSPNIVGIAGGSGITPFLSIAKEIEHGTLDFNLTILYGSNTTSDIILKDELLAIKSPRVKVINVIANEPDYKGEKGFINADIIKKYSLPDCTYLICGPYGMYKFIEGELDKLNIAMKRIRMETFGAPKDISTLPDYPKEKINDVYKLTVYRGKEKNVIEALAKEPIMVAMERAGIKNPSRCRSGSCGICRCLVIEGDFYIPKDKDLRRYGDKKYNYVQSCSTYPLSDMTIKINIE